MYADLKKALAWIAGNIKTALFWVALAVHIGTGFTAIMLVANDGKLWHIVAAVIAIPITLGWVHVMRETRLDDRLPASPEEWGGGQFFDPAERQS